MRAAKIKAALTQLTLSARMAREASFEQKLSDDHRKKTAIWQSRLKERASTVLQLMKARNLSAARATELYWRALALL